jgi:hypothetical protein
VSSRTHICLLLALLLGRQGASAAESAVERQFSDQRKTFTCVEGPTKEPSCSGTGLVVYLRGDQVEHLDWTVEMSTKFVRQQFYFSGSRPVLMVETIHAKLDGQANLLKEPKLLSIMRYRLDDAESGKRKPDFLEHAEFLIHYFHEHRSDFTPSGHPNT